jgi:hypothetical protein
MPTVTSVSVTASLVVLTGGGRKHATGRRRARKHGKAGAAAIPISSLRPECRLAAPV